MVPNMGYPRISSFRPNKHRLHPSYYRLLYMGIYCLLRRCLLRRIRYIPLAKKQHNQMRGAQTMKITIQINNEPVEIMLTPKQHGELA